MENSVTSFNGFFRPLIVRIHAAAHKILNSFISSFKIENDLDACKNKEKRCTMTDYAQVHINYILRAQVHINYILRLADIQDHRRLP
jgi:hypothetical protein